MPNLFSHIKTARRSDSEYNVSLAKRRMWFTDPPTGDPPAGDPPPAKPPIPDPKPELKFTQEDMDAKAGNRAKEAQAAERRRIYKELGIENPDDPDALKSVKTKLTAAQQAEEAQLTATQKLERERDAAIKERDDAKALAVETENKRKDTLLNTRLEGLATKSGAQFPEDVIAHARNHYADKVSALMGEDGTIDPKKASELIDEIKKARPNFFDQRKGAGTGSHGGGRLDNGGVEQSTEAARSASFARARRAT